MKRRTKNQWREVGACNSHDLCRLGGGCVYVAHQTTRSSRWFPARVSVVGLDIKTNPNAPWWDRGCQSFRPFSYSGTSRDRRRKAEEEAKAWAAEKYGIKEWVRDPWGAWQDAEVFSRAMAVELGGVE